MGKDINETTEVTEVSETVETTETTTKRKKKKVLTKDLKSVPGSLVLTIVGVEGSITYNPNDLPVEVQENLPAFALSHKLGDAASGKSGTEAAEAIGKVWEGMLKGDWTVRAPAAKKISVTSIIENLGNLGADEQEKARAALAALGITL